MTSRETPLSRPNRTTRIKSYNNKLKHLTLTKDTRWQWNILIPLDWSDTVTSSFTKTSVSTVRKSLGKTVCSRLSSTPLSAGWESIFEKQIPDSCGRSLKECFESKYVKVFCFIFPWNLFANIPRIHRMANQVDDKSQRAIHLNFSTVSDFHCLRIPYFFPFWSSIRLVKWLWKLPYSIKTTTA